MTYTITAKSNKLFGKNFKFKKVKGHAFPQDIPNNIMLIVMDDESRHFININDYTIALSKENFYLIKDRVEKEKTGQ